LGFGGQNKFVYQILAELDDDQSGGIDFAEFLRLATAKLSDKESRVEVDKVFGAFDLNRAVIIFDNSGKIHHFRIKKSRSGFGRGSY
jgi:Ca2+-binding EF-hand superfamily protein